MADVEMKQFSKKRGRSSSGKRVRYSSSSSSARILNTKLGPQPEMKCIDIGEVKSAFAVAGTVTLLNGVVQGTDINKRVGRRYCLKSLQIRSYIQSIGSFTVPAKGFGFDRAMLVYDRQPNGVAPVLSDFVINMSSGTTNATTFMNLNNSKRFVVLAYKEWQQATVADGTALVPQVIDCTDKTWRVWVPKMKIKNLVTEFNAGVAGTVADINVGAIWLVTWGQYDTPSQLIFSSRTRFCDL